MLGEGPIRVQDRYPRPIIDPGLLVGRILLAVLGSFYWLYTLKPRLPVVRSMPYFWRGNLPPAVEWRVFAAAMGTFFIALAVSIGPPFH